MKMFRVLAISMAVSAMLLGAAWAQDGAADNAALQELQKSVEQLRKTVPTSPEFQPAYPAVIQAAADQGAQVRFLGKMNGFNGWLLLSQGNPAYVYVSEDGKTIFQGLMFDDQGTPLTMRQIGALEANEAAANGGELPPLAEPSMMEPDAAPAAQPSLPTAQNEDRSPGETLYDALSVVNSVTLGSTDANAPLLYAFIDPDCPHCKDFLKEADAPYLQTKKIQLRVIPIGILGENSQRKAAYILTQPDGGAQLMAQANGGKALPAPSNLTLDGQQLNTDLFRLWKFDGTPILVFKDKSGKIMMVRGAPNNLPSLVNSIAAGGA